MPQVVHLVCDPAKTEEGGEEQALHAVDMSSPVWMFITVSEEDILLNIFLKSSERKIY